MIDQNEVAIKGRRFAPMPLLLSGEVVSVRAVMAL